MSTASGARSERASEVLLEALPQLLNSGTPPPPHVISRLFHAVLTASAPSGGTLQATSSTETQTFKLRALASLASAATTQVCSDFISISISLFTFLSIAIGRSLFA